MASFTPEAFAKRWADSGLTERSAYQQHFLDLCDMLGALQTASGQYSAQGIAFWLAQPGRGL